MERFQVIAPYQNVALNPERLDYDEFSWSMGRYALWFLATLFWFFFPGYGISYALSLVLGDAIGWTTLALSTAAFFGLGTNSWRMFYALRGLEDKSFVSTSDRYFRISAKDLAERYFACTKRERMMLPENFVKILRKSDEYDPSEMRKFFSASNKVLSRIERVRQENEMLAATEKTYRDLGGSLDYLEMVTKELDTQIEASAETRKKLAIG